MEITEKYLSFAYKTVTGKIFLAALITFIIFLAVILPWESERSGERLGFEKSPDSSFIYSQAELYEMAEAYGEEGRSYYISSRFSFDIIWPLVYFFFLWSGMALILKNFSSRLVRSLLLLPFLGTLFDFLENLGASLVMYRYPAETFLIDQLTPGFTFLKWIFIYLSFIVLLLGAGIRLYHRIKS
ncbi:MAG: hypothetical protein ABR596_03950 [Halarsenatibacteraceae bacterium]